MYVGELANLIAAFLFVWPLWFLYQKLGANRKAAVEALLLSIVIRTACACLSMRTLRFRYMRKR